MIQYFPTTTSISLKATLGFNMKIKYFPAEFGFSKYVIKEKHISWYTKNSIIHHPHLLISYGHRPDIPLRSFIDDENVTILGDSGGFQAVTLNQDFKAEDVIKWQNENCNIGITLDRPPLRKLINISEEDWFKGDEFDKYMKISNDNANLMMSTKSQNLKLYLALHGFNKESRKRWLMNGLKEYQNWDGYAIASKPNSDLQVLADWLIFAKENNLKNIHLLAISGTNTLPILVYMSQYFDNVWFDSSSYSMGSRQRNYFLPFTYRKSLSLASMKENSIPKVLPCDCNVCSQIEDTNIFTSNENTGWAGWLINMHNIVQTQRYITLLAGTVHNREIFDKIVGDKVVNILNYIDKALQKEEQVVF